MCGIMKSKYPLTLANMILRLIRMFFRWFLRLFRKPFRPKPASEWKPGEWARFVKSFHFDRLPTSRKGMVARQILSFRQ